MALKARALKARALHERGVNPTSALETEGMPVGEMLSQAGSNIIPSGRRAVEDVVSVVADPIGTAKNLGSVVSTVARRIAT